jgi:hypothetical protein
MAARTWMRGRVRAQTAPRLGDRFSAELSGSSPRSTPSALRAVKGAISLRRPASRWHSTGVIEIRPFAYVAFPIMELSWRVRF